MADIQGVQQLIEGALEISVGQLRDESNDEETVAWVRGRRDGLLQVLQYIDEDAFERMQLP